METSASASRTWRKVSIPQRPMYFCIRDDDTSYFTAPDELEAAYGEITKYGPVSLAVVPFHRAGDSKGVPEKYRGRWTVHPLHENMELVQYLRAAVAAGRFEIMLHGYYHDERETRFEFNGGAGLVQRVTDGRKYLQDLLGTKIRVFVAPRNAIGREGLRAISQSGLNLGGTAGIRAGWPTRLQGHLADLGKTSKVASWWRIGCPVDPRSW